MSRRKKVTKRFYRPTISGEEMTEAEIKQYIKEDLKSLDLNLSVKSIEDDGAGAWSISTKCPRCGNVDFTVREYGDSPIKEQIQAQLHTHAVTH
jgi:hypothetical protein